MATIAFRGKIRTAHYPDGELAYRYISVPKLATRHCDMAAFRVHPQFGDFANSDLFPNILNRLRNELFPAGYIRVDSVPANVTVDESGFLAEVTITV